MEDDLSAALVKALFDARTQRRLSISALAESSGVWRAMISRVENAEAQPSAALLGRLSGALGMTLSELIAQAEGGYDRGARRSKQSVWTDPATGYTRRAVSQPSESPLELVEVMLPPGAEVGYPADAYRFMDQVVWVLEGAVRITEGEEVHELSTGDCLRFGPPRDTDFANPTTVATRYLVALDKRVPRA